MGFIFRKSLNLGLFRVNLSKHGFGFSFGMPGFRKTYGSNGINRTTYNIPGTGISYVKTSKRKSK